jgi:hypothetical protein
MRNLLLIVTFVLASAPAVAGPPAAIPDAGHRRAERAFEEFAADWMSRVHALEQKARSSPSVKAGASDPVFTYRGYGDDYTVELRPTGHARAPYVGLLRYTEHLYSCATLEANRCSIASTVPVTEVFRYKNGRWTY